MLRITQKSRRRLFQTLGVSGYVEAKYLVAKNIGIALTVKPQLNIFNFHTFCTKDKDDPKPETTPAKGLALGFAMPVSIGVSYSF